MTPAPRDDARTGTFSRRRLLGTAGAGALAVGAAGVGGWAYGQESEHPPQGVDRAHYPFDGIHQAGITTPAQDRLHFAAFDVTTGSRDALIGLLKEWTAAARQMTAGGPVEGSLPTPYDAPPTDTGEALGCDASGLTLTFGFGPGLFERAGRDRFGIGDRRPRALRELPHFPADNLDPAPTTRRWPCTRSATSPGSGSARRPCAGRSSASVGRPPPRRSSRLHATCSASRTAPRTSSPRTPPRWTGSCGSSRAMTAGPTGWPTVPTWSPGASTCTSSRGTGPACASRKR